MRKDEALERWQALEPSQNPLPYMQAIPYKAEGSTFGACGIRIDGNPEFVDAVLSCLKPLMEGENRSTRLGLNRNEVKPKEIGDTVKGYHNADQGAEYCYVRLHERGPQAMYFGKRK